MATPTKSKTNVRPLADRVVVEPITEEQTAGGIYIPDTAREKPQRGVVLAVGEGRLRDDGKREPVGVKVGDKVLFGKYGSRTTMDIKIDGKEIKILAEEDIFAVLEE